MSLRSSGRRRRLEGAPALPVSTDYKKRFVQDAHTLIAEGYNRLRPHVLSDKEEEVISGLIVKGTEEWLSGRDAPDWSSHYFIKPEMPDGSGTRDGKRRPRIDIYVEASFARPRPRMGFEAKRFYENAGAAAYLGKDGLGAFVSGQYLKDAPAGAMLGYVQKGLPKRRIEQVRKKLEKRRQEHGLCELGEVWSAIEFDKRIGCSWMSTHKRADGSPIDIYHTFLLCWEG